MSRADPAPEAASSSVRRGGAGIWVAVGCALAMVVVLMRVLLRDDPPAPSPAPESPRQESAGAGTRPRPAQAASRSVWTATRGADDEVRTDRAVPRPLHTKSRYPPGTRIPVGALPDVEIGIPLPDGRHLPFLNGMNFAPPVQRAEHLGPLPKVVALVVDADGFEWWEHADGSVTTSRYEHVIAGDRDYWDPATPHGAVAPAQRLRAQKR